MAALTSFPCTACGKTLKSPKPVPEGTKIKCPKCAAVFVVGNGEAPRKSGGDFSGMSAPRRSKADTGKRSSPIVKWGVCFAFSFLLSLIFVIPMHISMSAVNSMGEEMKKGMPKDKDMFKDLDKDFQKEFEKKMKESMKDQK